LLFLFGMVGDTCVLVDFSLSEQRGILVWHSKQFFCSFYKQRFMGMLVLFRDKLKPKVGNRIMAIKTENDRMFWRNWKWVFLPSRTLSNIYKKIVCYNATPRKPCYVEHITL
jgi:hypothetical protein